ncbi:hypothetical protein [Bradyrhizobium sp. BR 1432]|uniref:hypothetical protein n=1 Tax=Bradyrhizobium sp. BR 1432 TaxID=3447966 RepID=UPI003EE74501
MIEDMGCITDVREFIREHNIELPNLPLGRAGRAITRDRAVTGVEIIAPPIPFWKAFSNGFARSQTTIRKSKPRLSAA